ncbi:MAG: hypothetical protein ACXVZL_05975 [Gaiellaceae bacterium]
MNLGPVRDVLLAEARTEGDRILAAGDVHAATVVSAAEQRGRERVAAGRREGAAAAAIAGAHELAEARRAARAAVLEARATLHRELVDATLAEAARLREDVRHDALLVRLTVLARRQLGQEAHVEEAPEGGIRATAGVRSVDYTLPTLVGRALDRGEIEGLWA